MKLFFFINPLKKNALVLRSSIFSFVGFCNQSIFPGCSSKVFRYLPTNGAHVREFQRGRIVGFRDIRSSHNAEKQKGTAILPETHASLLY